MMKVIHIISAVNLTLIQKALSLSGLKNLGMNNFQH